VLFRSFAGGKVKRRKMAKPITALVFYPAPARRRWAKKKNGTDQGLSFPPSPFPREKGKEEKGFGPGAAPRSCSLIPRAHFHVLREKKKEEAATPSPALLRYLSRKATWGGGENTKVCLPAEPRTFQDIVLY